VSICVDVPVAGVCDLYVCTGSSNTHFLLSAHTLVQEHRATFVILSILYLYPLASVTLFVDDVLWFARHHYAFYSMLLEAGYIRVDPFEPHSRDEWTSSGGLLSTFNALYLCG
jgi:hypothetical protein